MARIQITKVQVPPEFAPLQTSTTSSQPTLTPHEHSALPQDPQVSPPVPQIRITPPSQAHLLRKPVPGSVLRRPTPISLPHIQAFFSAKGGSGTSLLAATYAGAAKAVSGLRVLLVDMDLAAGGIDSFTGITPNRTIYHLKPVLNELADSHMRSVVQTDPVTGIDILASPNDPQFANSIDAWEIEALIKQSRISYDLVVIDGGSHLHPLTVPLLAAVDRIHYVMQPDAPSLRKYKMAEAWMHSKGIALQKMAVLLNRAGKTNEIQPRDLGRFAALQIEGTVRSDFVSIQSEINLAQPLMLRYGDKKPPGILQDILRLIRQQTGQVET